VGWWIPAGDIQLSLMERQITAACASLATAISLAKLEDAVSGPESSLLSPQSLSREARLR